MLMPITRPFASSRGPPELPGLIAASVWIALPIPKRVSDWMLRSIADTTPTDSDCLSPNGAAYGRHGLSNVDGPECPSGRG